VEVQEIRFERRSAVDWHVYVEAQITGGRERSGRRGAATAAAQQQLQQQVVSGHTGRQQEVYGSVSGHRHSRGRRRQPDDNERRRGRRVVDGTTYDVRQP